MMSKKKNILITGASQGIGLAIARHFAKHNNVYVVSRNEEKLEKLCKEYKFAGYFAVDLTKHNIIDIDVDGLVNNAGVYFYSPIEKMKEEDILNSIKLNTIAPYMLIKSVVPSMKKRGFGRIINIGSISGVMGEANASIYSMTKASLIGLTKSLALELAQDNITVNIINPGWVDTELINNENLEEDFSKDEIIETIPQRRFVDPEEIASTCEFLISDKAKTITGQSINICAGLSLGF